MSNKEELYLEKIAKELHIMNKTLALISQAPIFSKSRDDLEEQGVYIKDIIPQKKQAL